MSIELTTDQRRELSHPVPTALDPETGETYVLVRREVYDRIRHLIEGDELGLDMRLVAILVDRAMREEDADDPTMEFYQEKYGKKP